MIDTIPERLIDEELQQEVRLSRKRTAQRGARWVAGLDEIAFEIYEPVDTNDDSRPE